jgi:hypothetical protein
VLRYSDLRLDASTLQELADGGIKVQAALTHPGLFTYANPDGTPRREYRPAEEVFRKAAMDTFAGAPVTINHPHPDGQGRRLVTAQSWKKDAVGHLGENVREDAGHMVADIYIRDAEAVKQVRAGNLKHVSCGYNVDYDATPGTTPEGQRFDGVQRNIRGNHVAMLPLGVAPRGGSECVLRLDSQGDEEYSPDRRELKYRVDELDLLKSKVTALESELAKARTDAAEVPKLKNDLTAANARIAELGEALKPERMDAAADARATVTAAAKADGIETAGKSTLSLKKEIVSKRTPDLASRVDSMSEEAVDAVMAVYGSLKPAPVAAPLAVLAPPAVRTDAAPPVTPSRSDAVDSAKIPKYADMYERHLQKSLNAWKSPAEKVN